MCDGAYRLSFSYGIMKYEKKLKNVFLVIFKCFILISRQVKYWMCDSAYLKKTITQEPMGTQ